MLKAVKINIADIYVPTALRGTLDPEKVDAAAESLMDDSEDKPIQVRKGKDRYVLLRGLHRVEACKALGEDFILAFIVGAKKF